MSATWMTSPLMGPRVGEACCFLLKSPMKSRKLFTCLIRSS